MNKFFTTILLCLIYAASAGAAPVPYPAEINADAPLAYYRFAEPSGGSLADSSGKNRSLVLRGGYTRNAPELLINAAASDRATTLTNASASTAEAWYSTIRGASVSMMIKFNSLTGNQTFFEAGTENSAVEGFHRLYYREDVRELKWLYNYANGSGATDLAAMEWTPVIGRTYHLAVTHDYAAKTITFYLDGKVFKSVTHRIAPLPVINRTVNFFSGVKATVDEFALFKSALPEARVKAQFAASRQSDSTAAAYYASPAGTIYGRGTLADPLDLPTLFNFGLLGAGDTAYLKAGTYTGIFSVNVSGGVGVGNHIKIRPVIGEVATLDGAGLEGDVLTLNGSNLDVSHLIVRKTWLVRENSQIGSTRSAIAGSASGESVGGAGIAMRGANLRVFLNVIHDIIGDGAGFGSATVNATFKQNLVFNNGWYAPRNAEDVAGNNKQPNGHGIYAQNKAPSLAVISDNVFFNNYGAPVKIAGSGDSFSQNCTLIGNVMVGGGFGSIIGGGDVGISKLIFSRNKLFGGNVQLGYSSFNDDVVAEYNYLAGGFNGLEVDEFNRATLRYNEFIPHIGGESVFRYLARTGYDDWIVDNNTYWAANPQWGVKYRPISDNKSFGKPDWNAYRAATRWDANSAYNASPDGKTPAIPKTNKVFIEPQTDFEPNRGRVVVYNWAKQKTQTVNLSTILAAGASYEIRSASNYFAGAIKSGTFSAANPTVVLPLTVAAGLPAQALPYGDGARNPDPAPNFAVFMIIPTSAAAPNN